MQKGKNNLILKSTLDDESTLRVMFLSFYLDILKLLFKKKKYFYN